MKYNLHIVRGGLEDKLPETRHCETCACLEGNDNYDSLSELAGQRRKYSYGIFIGGPYESKSLETPDKKAA